MTNPVFVLQGDIFGGAKVHVDVRRQTFLIPKMRMKRRYKDMGGKTYSNQSKNFEIRLPSSCACTKKNVRAYHHHSRRTPSRNRAPIRKRSNNSLNAQAQRTHGADTYQSYSSTDLLVLGIREVYADNLIDLRSNNVDLNQQVSVDFQMHLDT